MAKKLTLSRLTPYLPFKLNCKISTPLSGFREYGDILTINTIKIFGAYQCVIKPILYPLARLTEEAFSGKLYIEEIVNDTEQHCDAYDEWVDSYIDNPTPERILQAPYEVVLELFKQHYNVFNLAPNLYIDKSTLRQ